MRDPHIVLQLPHVFFGCGLLGERPGQHELGFEYGPTALHKTVQGRHHPRDCRVLHTALHGRDASAGVAFVPGAVERFCCCAQLHDQIAGQVLGLGFTAFFAPEAHQGHFIAPHNDSSVRTTDERAAILVGFCPHVRLHIFLQPEKIALADRLSRSRSRPYGMKYTVRY